MNGESTKDTEVIDDDEVLSDPEETVVLTEVEADDELSETIVNLNVDALVKKIEDPNSEEFAKQREAKKRLDQLQEQLDTDDEFGSTYAFDLDEDLTT